MSRSRRGLSHKWNVLEERVVKSEALAADRKKLLRRAYRMLERCGGELPSIFERHDRELMNELDEELGND